jgi:methylmalonyl-CoA mutase cobalamin-binding domain/chain
MNTQPWPPGGPARVVIAKPGLDGHDRAAKIIARAPRELRSIVDAVRQAAGEAVRA